MTAAAVVITVLVASTSVVAILVSEAATSTPVIASSQGEPSIKQEGGARRILITTEPKILVSRIDVEGLRRPNQERII